MSFKYGDNEKTIGYKVTRTKAEGGTPTIVTGWDDKTTVDTLAADLKKDSAKFLTTSNLFDGTNTTIKVSDLKGLAKNDETISVKSSATPTSYTFSDDKIVIDSSTKNTTDKITLTITKGKETAEVIITDKTDCTAKYTIDVQ